MVLLELIDLVGVLLDDGLQLVEVRLGSSTTVEHAPLLFLEEVLEVFFAVDGDIEAAHDLLDVLNLLLQVQTLLNLAGEGFLVRHEAWVPVDEMELSKTPELAQNLVRVRLWEHYLEILHSL